jgi:catechol 2,3-dioxygenase-like lactoylglutathione lyase family enzyme
VSLHHVELWVRDLDTAAPRWSWLFGELGWSPHRSWPGGRSWSSGDVYVVLEQSSALVPGAGHDRMRPGLNHLALHAGARESVDALVAAAGEHGWSLLFAERHPYAGGPDHYAAFLEDEDGFEVEIVAGPASQE